MPSPAKMLNVAMCALLVLNVAVVSVRAHAYLKVPASRQFLNPMEYTPSGANGRDPRPEAVCGDYGNQPTLPVFGKRAPYDRVPVQNHFVAGQKATFTVYVLAAHKGRFEYRICQYSGAETTSTLTKQCLDKHVLQPVDGPRIVKGMPYWWLGNSGGGEFTMDFIIPSDLNCDGVNTFCVMQMMYQNGNSCNPPGPSCPVEEPSFCFPTGYNPVCTLSGWETFRNCIDVVVKPSGGRAPVGGAGQGTQVTTTPPVVVTPKKTPMPPMQMPPKTGSGDACCKGKSDGLHPNPTNCRLVCMCQGGITARKLACRVGFKFDNIRKKCRVANYVSC